MPFTTWVSVITALKARRKHALNNWILCMTTDGCRDICVTWKDVLDAVNDAEIAFRTLVPCGEDPV